MYFVTNNMALCDLDTANIRLFFNCSKIETNNYKNERSTSIVLPGSIILKKIEIY
jgi:hypothetical protein